MKYIFLIILLFSCTQNEPERDIKLDCHIHGKTNAMVFSYDDIIVGKYCFLCWVEKTGKGLKDYK